MASMEDLWAERAKGMLKAELKRRNMTYADLASLLTKSGAPYDERNLRNKVARGSFTAAFMLLCLSVIGCQGIRMDDFPVPVGSL